MHICWCGNSKFLFFNTDYSKCSDCGTLVSLKVLPGEQLQVLNDETDFYGKKYWLNHQSEDFGYPDIYNRARNDLIERNLYWLRTLLKYCLPPANVLELGCSHGSFVALLQQAGYNASGVEMSPWVVEFGQIIFGIPISVGPVEQLEIPFGSLDVIVLMDVLEHLSDPVATMSYCLQLLKPDGLLLIQTPQFKEGMNYTALLETKGAFLEHLKPDEHLYLFSDHSVTRLFKQLGAEYIHFELAIFSHYDMFFLVSRASLNSHDPNEIESALLSTPNGRIALALLDLRKRELDLVYKWEDSEADRAARWKQIETLTILNHIKDEQLQILDNQVREVNTIAADREIQNQKALNHKAEQARLSLEQIHQLNALIQEKDEQLHNLRQTLKLSNYLKFIILNQISNKMRKKISKTKEY